MGIIKRTFFLIRWLLISFTLGSLTAGKFLSAIILHHFPEEFPKKKFILISDLCDDIMDNSFEVTILYKNATHEFPARLITYGYTYKIEVEVFGYLISFERDDERNFRAILHYDDIANNPKIDKEVLRKIAEELEKI